MRHRQRGMSILGMMFLAAIIGLLFKVVVTCVPPYLDFHSLDTSIRGTLNELKGTNVSVTDFRKSLSMHMQVEGAAFQSQDDLTVSKDGNTLNVGLKYDVVRPLAGNIDMVFHFDKTYSSDAAGE